MLSIEKLGVNSFTYDDDVIESYTGFPTYSVYIAFSLLWNLQLKKWKICITSNDLSFRERPKSVILVDELEKLLIFHFRKYKHMGNPRANCAENATGFSSPLSKNSNYNRMYQVFFYWKSSSLALASKTFSSYESHNTWKGLVGIAPNGAVTFISFLYTGCMSDVEMNESCGLIDL